MIISIELLSLVGLHKILVPVPSLYARSKRVNAIILIQPALIVLNFVTRRAIFLRPDYNASRIWLNMVTKLP